MTSLYFLAFRNIRVRKSRTLLTVSGVAWGVALVLAVSITPACCFALNDPDSRT